MTRQEFIQAIAESGDRESKCLLLCAELDLDLVAFMSQVADEEMVAMAAQRGLLEIQVTDLAGAGLRPEPFGPEV